MAVRFFAILCSLALVAVLGPPVSAHHPGGDGSDAAAAAKKKKKKCKRGRVRRHGKCVKRPPPRPPEKDPLHSGIYYDSQNKLRIDVDKRSLNYSFYQPCIKDGLQYVGETGVDGKDGTLPGTKVGTKLELSGTYTTPRIGQSVPQTTDWHMKGQWTSASRFDGTLEFSVDIPAEGSSAAGHCDYPPTPIHLNG